MKRKLNNIMFKFGGMFAALALVVTTASANAACMWFIYQEPLPDEAKKLRKF
jgi:cyclic lactone autoinducer peptide